MRVLLKTILAVTLLIAPQAYGADYWASNVSTGSGTGANATNTIGWSTESIRNLMGGTLTTGNRVFVCGTLTSTSTWNPGGVSGTGIFEVNGSSTLSGCEAGGWDQDFQGSSLVSIGGGGRQNIRMTDLFFRDCTGNCVQADGTNIIIASSTFYNALDSHVVIGTLASNGAQIQGNTFLNWGNATATAEAGVNIQARDGIAVSNALVQNNTFSGNGIARYGVNNYPAQTLNNGTTINTRILNNRFYGSYRAAPVNISNNATGTQVIANDFSGMTSAGGVVIHTGGQGLGTGMTGRANCPTQTVGSIITDNTGVQGAIFNDLNTGDAAGILIDECSFQTQVLRNETYNNQLAGIYFNDAEETTVIGNLMWNNGLNCIHMHGTSTNNVFYNNSCYHNPTNPSGFAVDGGWDGVQMDALATNNVFKNNLFIGGPIVQASSSIKGMDLDVTGTLQKNAVFGFTTATEGATDSGLITSRPQIRNFPVTKASDFRLLPDSNLYATGTPVGRNIDAGGRLFNQKPSVGAWEYGYRDFTSKD